jgi:hypothetical protein
MNRPRIKWFQVSCLALILTLYATSVQAQSTAFTYQGRLNDSGTPANGPYDMQFSLFDAPVSGNQIGTTLLHTGVTVTNGVFTVTFDFGAAAFSGADRWLEIAVRPGSSTGAFATLSPLQPITAAPYAMQSLNATSAANAGNAAQLGGVSASQYVLTSDSRLSDARTPAAGSSNYIQNTTSLQAGNFSISGNGQAGGVLSANVVNADAQYNLGGSRILGVLGIGGTTYLGIGAASFNPGGTFNSFFGNEAGNHDTSGYANSFFGTSAGHQMTDACCNAFFGDYAGYLTNANNNAFFGSNAGSNNSSGADNAFFGEGAGNSNTTGFQNVFIGSSSGRPNSTGNLNIMIGSGAGPGANNLINATAIGTYAEVDRSNAMVLGSIAGVNFASFDTSVGIGTTAPYGKLHVTTANDTNSNSVFNWDARHVVIGGPASTGAIGMSYDQDQQVGFIEALSPGVAWRNLILDQGGGKVGIGTASPDNTLTVNGTADKPGGGSWAVFSDERLKNINGAFTSGIETVMQLQPVRYEYKSENAMNLKSAGEHIGFSAQEVQKILPEAVTTNDAGYLLVNNDPILWTMLNAIKEQQQQLDQQRRENSRLQQVLDAQRRELDAIEKLVCPTRLGTAVCP